MTGTATDRIRTSIITQRNTGTINATRNTGRANIPANIKQKTQDHAIVNIRQTEPRIEPASDIITTDPVAAILVETFTTDSNRLLLIR